MKQHNWTGEDRRKSDDWFRLLIETMNEGLGVQDKDGLVIYVNRRLCEILGYSQDEITGHPRTTFLDEANQAILKEHIARHKKGWHGSSEIAWTAKDGRQVFTVVLSKPIFDKQGHFEGDIAVITDISERKRVEEQLLKFSSAVEQSPSAVVITDTAGNIEYVNPKFTQLTGYTTEEVIGKNPRLLQSGKTPREVYEQLWGTITACREWRGEVQDRKKNGELYWAFDSIAPIRNAQGAITHFLGLQEDVTERKRVEEALRESERKYSTLVESSLTGIYIVQDGIIAFANPRFAEIFGYAKDEIMISMNKLIHPEDRAFLDEATAKRLKGQEASEQYTIKGVKKNGDTIWIKGSDTCIDYQGKPAILGNVVDVTQQKHMEEIMEKSERELHLLSQQLLMAQEQERKRISSELHDGIQQYLSAIKLSVENALNSIGKNVIEMRDKSLGDVVVMFQEAIEEVRRIAMDLRPSTLDDLGILASINWYCRRFQGIYSGIHIEKHFSIEEHEVPDQLKTVIYRVLQEALNNVAKHAQADLVQLRLGKTHDTIEMVIEDNGLGFELKEPIASEGSGTGLGLVTMRERTVLSGGSFSIDSTPGAGTKVRASWDLSRH